MRSESSCTVPNREMEKCVSEVKDCFTARFRRQTLTTMSSTLHQMWSCHIKIMIHTIVKRQKLKSAWDRNSLFSSGFSSGLPLFSFFLEITIQVLVWFRPKCLDTTVLLVLSKSWFHFGLYCRLIFKRDRVWTRGYTPVGHLPRSSSHRKGWWWWCCWSLSKVQQLPLSSDHLVWVATLEPQRRRESEEQTSSDSFHCGKKFLHLVDDTRDVMIGGCVAWRLVSGWADMGGPDQLFSRQTVSPTDPSEPCHTADGNLVFDQKRDSWKMNFPSKKLCGEERCNNLKSLVNQPFCADTDQRWRMNNKTQSSKSLARQTKPTIDDQ